MIWQILNKPLRRENQNESILNHENKRSFLRSKMIADHQQFRDNLFQSFSHSPSAHEEIKERSRTNIKPRRAEVPSQSTSLLKSARSSESMSKVETKTRNNDSRLSNTNDEDMQNNSTEINFSSLFLQEIEKTKNK